MNRVRTSVVGLLVLAGAVLPSRGAVARQLTLYERIEAQRAIERVCGVEGSLGTNSAGASRANTNPCP
jgi:hypothetical protein